MTPSIAVAALEFQFRPQETIMKSTFRRLIAASLIASLGLAPLSRADDIDLYTGGESSTGAQTNVLIVLDNSANWNAQNQGWTDGAAQGQAELQALSEVASTLGDNVNVGLLMASGNGGGYIRYAIREMNSTNRTAFINMLNQADTDFTNATDRGNYWQVASSDTHYEGMLNHAFRYYAGLPRLANDMPQGSNPDMRDFDGNSNSTTRQPSFPNALGGYSLPVLPHTTATNYVPPTSVTSGCAKNFIIFIGNGYPSQFDAKSDLTTAAALVGDVADVSDVSGGDNTAAADEWTRYLYVKGIKSTVNDPKNTSQKLRNKIATYTIDVCKNGCTTGSGPNQGALLSSMAKVGGGKYFRSTSKAEIKNALALIFAEIQAVNSVFASATLPISVNTQGTYENQVYIGVFRPDGGSRPRWFGNLKEYKFGRYCDADRNDKVLIDTTRTLVNGMIPATLTGTATGTVTGSFAGSITNLAGTTTAVSGTVTGTISGTASGTLAATLSSSAGTTVSPAADLGAGTVTGTITGTGTGSGTSTFTGTLYATPSVSGSFTASDERIGDDVPAPSCGTDATGKIPLNLYMGDKNGFRAIDEEGNTGFVDLSAKSYWTSDSSYWAFQPSDTGSTSDLPDGPSVEKGAAAQRLRQVWANTATNPHPDGRKIYTCLGNCLLSSGTASEKTLSNNSFTTSNTTLTSALAAPSGAATVTLARSGNTVTATSTSSHGFNDGDSITIAGATPTAYNGTKTITYLTSTTFSYPITESPSTSETVTAATLGASTATTGTLSATTAGATVTVTLAAPTGLPNGALTADISGASLALLNGTKSGTVAGGVFTYSATLPANPVTPLVGNATVKCGTNASETATATWSSATGKFTFTTTNTTPSAFVGCKNFSGSVEVSGASNSLYNGTWTIAASDKGTGSFLAGTLAAQAAVSASYAMTITMQGTIYSAATLSRSLGSQTVTISRAAGMAAITNGATVQVSGATDTSYNANWTVSSVSGVGTTSFTFTGPALAPTTPPTGTITATPTAASSTGPTTANLINWMRGKDLWEDEDLNGSLTNVRASIHGDVLHSRPVVVNYGSTIGIVGFYGSNDGYLRAIHGGISSNDGEEKWAFIPTEFLSYTKLSRLYNNSELVRFPNSSCSVSPAPTARNYFWDGVITAYQSADGTATTAPTSTWLFATMRRGGRAIYALDVSNPDTPKFMWRITSSSTGFSELGQTWSEPKVTKLKGTFTRSSGTVITNPVVLIFGAGYDAAQEDKREGAVITPTMGRGIFVVEAETGELVKFINPSAFATGYRSFPADVNVLDLNSDGFADRIYAADTNANIFRFDTVQTVTDVASDSYWKRYHIARLGDTSNDGGNDARKFMFQPEILPFTHNGVVKTMVLVGSGNREKPLGNFDSSGTAKTLTCSALYSDSYFMGSSSSKIRNRFYGVLDSVQSGTAEGGSPILESNLQQINANDGTLTAFSLSSTDKGWYIQLRNDPDGNGTRNEEKAVNAARVVAGTVFFASNTPVSPNPSAGICSNLGEALGYAVDPFTGMPAFNRDGSTSSGAATYTAADYATKFSGGGLPPTVTAGVVSIGGTPYRFIIGSGSESLTSASSIAGARSVVQLTGTRTRLYWSYGAD
jgi:type IV pilus assembly protein PilY1